MKQKNIYIFPSKQGLGFLAMLGLMLLTAINYQSSLVYLLVFILGGVFLISIWLCFFNLQGMSLRAEDVPPVQARREPRFSISRADNGKERSGIFGTLEFGDDYQQWPDSGNTKSIVLVAPPLGRGIYPMPALKAETYFPFGLIRAWTWLWFDVPVIVYPEPIAPPDAVDISNESDELGVRFQTNELSELKPFAQGESTRRIFWKHYARRDELVVRAPELADAKESELNYEQYANYGLELALSYLCYEVMSFSEQGRPFSLNMPGISSISGEGEEHRVRCLRTLAEFGSGGASVV